MLFAKQREKEKKVENEVDSRKKEHANLPLCDISLFVFVERRKQNKFSSSTLLYDLSFAKKPKALNVLSFEFFKGNFAVEFVFGKCAHYVMCVYVWVPFRQTYMNKYFILKIYNWIVFRHDTRSTALSKLSQTDFDDKQLAAHLTTTNTHIHKHNAKKWQQA